MSVDPALASVVASGCVAIAATLAPVFVTLVSQWLKWRHERRLNEAQQLDQATQNLFKMLTPYMTGSVDASHAAAGRGWARLYADLRSEYYAWERAIWPHCSKDEREQLKRLRADIAKRDSGGLVLSASGLADEILALAHDVGERIA